MIISLYRVPVAIAPGTYLLVAQYNSAKNKVKEVEIYRKEIFEEIQNHIIKNPTNDLQIIGDHNQDITSTEIKEFFESIKVRDIYNSYNLL